MRGNKTEREKAAEQTSGEADLDEPQNDFVWSFSRSSLSLNCAYGVAL